MLDPSMFEAMNGLLLDQDTSGDAHFYDKWDLLKACVEMHANMIQPEFPPEVLKTLMKFAKDQGNYMFRRKLFPFAHELYLLGTVIANCLRNRSVVNVDIEFVSVLYANLAFCKIKLDRFPEAVEAANKSISLNCNNEKAYYRLALALKAMHRYEKAMDAACKGENKSRDKGLLSDVRPFSELIRELQVHMPAAMPQVSLSQVSVPPVSLPQVSVPKVSLPVPPVARPAPVTVPPPMQLHQTSVPKPNVVVSVATPANAVPEADKSWLQGTNIHANKKPKELKAQATAKTKNKKKKGKQKVTQPPAQKAPPKRVQQYVASSEEEEEENSEEEESEDEQEYQCPNATANRFAIYSTNKEKQVTLPTAARNESAFGMGLDDFEDGASKIVAVKPQQSVPLPPPLGLKYETRLACSFCYSKEGEGILGSRYQEKVHSCARNILLCRSKEAETLWLKIRPRPQAMKMSTQTQFGGKFKLCQQYQAGIPCKIGENSCTFAHSQTEIEFWMLDRNGQLNIEDYMMQLKKVPHVPDVKNPVISAAPVPAAPKSLPSSIPPQPFNIKPPPKPTQPPLLPPQNSTVQQPVPVLPLLQNLNHNRPQDGYQQQGGYQQRYQPNQQQQYQQQAGYQQQYQQQTGYQQQSGFQQQHQQRYQHQQQYQYPHHPQYQQQQRLQSAPQRTLQGGISYIDVTGASSQMYQPQPLCQPPPHPQAVQPQQYQQTQSLVTSNWLENTTEKNAIQSQYGETHDDDCGEDYENMEFPLKETHDFGLVCAQCVFDTHGGPGALMINLQLEHKCDADMLVVKQKGQKTWTHIRPRLNHRQFHGRYILCRYFLNDPPQDCYKSRAECSYAHSHEEQFLWGLEKDNLFNIHAFILSKSSNNKTDCSRVDQLLRKYNGQFRFLCGQCFNGRPCHIVLQNPNNDKCSRDVHIWNTAKLLVHVNLQGTITPITYRPFVHKTAFFRMCNRSTRKEYCDQRIKSRCHFAHSEVERDVWYAEKDAHISREEIVALSEAYHVKIVEKVAAPVLANSGGQQMNGRAPGGPANLAPAVLHCPYNIIHVCDVCWKKGLLKTQRGERCNGPGNGHLWQLNKICMLVPGNKRIRPLPNKIPNNCHFIVCKHIVAKRTCDYSGGHCQFAHSTQEVEVWSWMVKNNVRTLDALINVSNKNHGTAPEANKKIQQGQSVVSTVKTPAPLVPPIVATDLRGNAQYCRYCGVICDSRRVWDEHCASDQHMFNVNSDKEHQWNFRQPPWGIVGSRYQLCELHLESACPYSHQPDMYNLCQCAHSPEELDEWRERWQWRAMKREVAKQEGVYSYMDNLLEDFVAADSGVNVITENLPGIEVSSDGELSVYDQDKNAVITWTFTVKVRKNMDLEKVALLYDQDRLHFSVEGYDLHPHTQIAQGAAFINSDSKTYSVMVKFAGGMFGSFMQWIVFDFGQRPVVGRKLNVELGTHGDQEQIKQMRHEHAFDRWTGDNRQIVRFNYSNNSRYLQKIDTFNKQLLRQYKAPTSADDVITQQSLVIPLNQHNYMHKMHQLLNMEELARQQIISSFNLKAVVELQEQIDEDYGMIFALPGELFARVPLNGQLSEDTNAGKLILTNVSHVLVSPQGSSDRVVYEAVIVEKENFDYDGRGKDYIYMCLSPICCRDLNLQKGTTLAMELQFQMSRLQFCRMHKAVDLLKDTKIVFPDLSLVKSGQRQTLSISSNVLNDDQLAIIRHVVAEADGYSPPLIIYGSFGTGKSETIAQATMLLLKQRPNGRILLCTHSNSAADLYISKHMDTFATGNPDMKMLRVYQEHRRLNTVPPIIQKYCLVSEDRSHFTLPTPEYIKNHHVVITTLTMALYLASCEELVGHFQHIFIDEAAQALECETIMPLALATESTCVVLAGDHMQMSPKVYSPGAQRQNLHQSLLERLFLHYIMYSSPYRPPCFNILLRKNYRTRMEILRFIAATFYGGPDRLECRSNQPESAVPALRFFAAHGCEVQDSDRTSYYNTAEIVETVDRVAELYSNWPAEWGRKDASKIGVVTPYYDQVQRLRASLRKRWNELGQVTVERVMNVQGKEFRALFITTVRTRHLLENPPNLLEGSECDGEIGDLGFLSDEKLLNTAMTRAESMVAVVGDPVALCIIGKSMNIWRTYLKHCQKMGTISPTTITLETVQAQVKSIMNSPIGLNLQKFADIAKQRKTTSVKPTPSSSSSTSNSSQAPNNTTTYAACAVRNSPERSNHSKMNSEQVEPDDLENPFDVRSDGGFFEDWSLEYRIEPDEILKQLAKEGMASMQKCAWAKPPQHSGGKEPQLPIDLSTPMKIEDVQVKRQQGHAVVHYRPNLEQESKKRKLLSGNDYERQFDSDSDISDAEEGNAGGDHTIYPDYPQQQLMAFLQASPERYKRCMLMIESSMNMFALDLDPRSQHKRLRISSRVRCGRGFDQDEVVVEVIQAGDDDRSAQPEEEQEEVQGRVVGILHRAISPKYRMFVCTVEEGNTGLMVPLNRGIPKLFNLETPYCHNKAKKGHVCVYTFSKNKEITFHHWESVDQADPGNKLFIVRYLKWDVKFYSPLGIVVGVLPAGTTVEHGMTILNMEHYIPKEFRDETLNECDHTYPSNFRLPDAAFHHRLDYRNKLCFTIDPPDSQDLDDALSIEPLPEDCYEVGIHIADVSYFIKAGSYIDNEAHTRGLTYYPVRQEPIPMLPNRLSTDLCSLKPGEDRLTLSIMLKVTHEGIVLRTTPRRSVIRSQHRLTYNEVETILTEGNEEYGEQLHESLLILKRISEIWRKLRLGNGALYQQLDADSRSCPTAHMLVEELMVQANYQVAKLLLGAFPTATPLRNQLQPNELELAMWRSLHQKQALQSVALTRAFLPKGQICSCDEECTCIEPVVFEPGRDFVNVSQSTWDKIKEAEDEDDLDLMQSLIVNPELYPQLMMALLGLQRLQERGIYVCSGDTAEDDLWHYSLNLPVYTHFTSPIRRYVDLVAQRLLVAYMDNKPTPYTQHDLRDIMAHCSDVTVKAKRYERATQALHINVVMKSKPLVLYPVVESVDQDSIRLHFPTMRHITPNQGTISMSRLNLSAAPRILEDDSHTVLSWQERIYDIRRKNFNTTSRNSVKPLLDTNRFVTPVPAHLWHQLITAILQEDQDRMLDVYDDIVQATDRMTHDPSRVLDVTSEVANPDTIEHFVNFEAEVGACTVLRVQLASTSLRGLVAPKLQLLSLTPTLDICLEHRSDPIRAFAEVSTKQATKQNYGSPEAYRDNWLAALRMEAAAAALSSDESAVIHNVPIVWRRKSSGSVYAVSTLPLSFCNKRQIKLSTSVEPSVNEENDATDKAAKRYYDYMCVRYSDITVETPPDVTNNIPNDDVNGQERVTWVGHCLVTMATRVVKTDQLIVHMDLHQSAIALPEELLTQSESTPRRATMEWIAKTLPDRRMEKAMCDLPLSRTTDLARDIALGRQPAALDQGILTQLSDLTSGEVPNLPAPNVRQQQAVRHALTQPFSLIQGPPGTGKTVTGVRLAYLFTELNRRAPGPKSHNRARPQVLYCGPSNKSVDVVAGYLKKLGSSCPKILRVYSEHIEQRDFPLPHDPLPSHSHTPRDSHTISATELALRDISLHHIIRHGDSAQAKLIRSWDMYFRSHPKDVTLSEISEYQKLVARAQLEVLKGADIVLCTCTASSSSKLLLGTNIRQVIIDECGMCREPETLVPIVELRPVQVVLIGDHRQLRPIVLTQAARQVGLEKSLFERYSDKAIMLTTQYRMHEAIAEFPSSQFYSDQLECGREEQKKASALKFWPGSRLKPMTFVHVVGREVSLAVSTSEGSEQSKSNALEVQHAVKIATILNRRFHVRAHDIVILSQYRAQCAEIAQQLHQKGQDETDTSTVIASQGSEWDYVILSTVRSLPKSRVETNPTRGWVRRNLGFITDQNQINVALSRARKGLIIIGNRHLLKVDPMWRKLLNHYERQKKIVDAHEFMK